MKFGKLALLASLSLVFAAPAFADTLPDYSFETPIGVLTGSGRGQIKSTDPTAAGGTLSTDVNAGSLQFRTGTSGDTGTTGGGNVRPTGSIISGSGDMAEYTQNQNFFYHFLANGSGAYIFNFNTVSPNTPVEFLQVTEGGITMKFYLTQMQDLTLGTNAVARPAHKATTGEFTGYGFVTFTNSTTHQLIGTDLAELQLTNTGTGAGIKSWSFEIDTFSAPEPSSLALLGTGILSTAGAAFRKRRKLA